MAARIKICWPDPGLDCLEGQCSYCRYRSFVPLFQVRRYAATRPELSRAIKYSERRGFPNQSYRA
jgi:hypothetical protein